MCFYLFLSVFNLLSITIIAIKLIGLPMVFLGYVKSNYTYDICRISEKKQPKYYCGVGNS